LEVLRIYEGGSLLKRSTPGELNAGTGDRHVEKLPSPSGLRNKLGKHKRGKGKPWLLK